MQRPVELIDYVPAEAIEKLAAFLLLIWCVSPLIILILKGCGQTNYLMAGLQWAYILWQIGMFGLLLGVVAVAQSLLAASRAAGSAEDEAAGSGWFLLWARRHAVPLLLLLLLLWSTVSCLLSSNIAQSFFGRQYVRDGLFTYYAYAGVFLCAYIVRRRRCARGLIEILVAVAAVLALFTALDSSVINNFLVIKNDCSVFYNINHYGYYLCLVIMLCAGLILLPGRGTAGGAAAECALDTPRGRRLLFTLRLAVLALLTEALMIDRSFGPVLAVTGGLSLLLLFTACFDRARVKKALAVLAVFMVVTVGYNYINGNLSKDFSRLYSDITVISQDELGAGQAGSGRWRLWVFAMEFAQEKPWFGYGPENTEDRYAQEDIVMGRPHNILLQLAISQGIPAMLLYLAALTALTAQFFRRGRRLTTFEIGLFCAVAAWFASSLLGVSMYYTSPFYFIILGLTGGALREDSRARVIEPTEPT